MKGSHCLIYLSLTKLSKCQLAALQGAINGVLSGKIYHIFLLLVTLYLLLVTQIYSAESP